MKSLMIATVVALIGTEVWADEFRTWTSTAGTAAEGRLFADDGTTVSLILKDGRRLDLPRTKLSEDDLAYLDALLEGGETEEGGAVVGHPEKEAKVDSALFKDRDEEFVFSEALPDVPFDVIETDHFIFYYLGTRPRAIPVLAEKLWQGMARQHPTFTDVWGSARQGVVLVDSVEEYESLSRWSADNLEIAGGPANEKAAQSQRATAGRTGSSSLFLSEAVYSEEGIVAQARIIRTDLAKADGVWPPFFVHCFSNDMISRIAGLASLNAIDVGEGFFVLKIGQSYLKEIGLAREVQTMVISAEGSEGTEVFTPEQFADGREWPAIIREAIRKGDAEPSLARMRSLTQPSLNQETVALSYALVRFMQGTPERLVQFGELMALAREAKAMPEAIVWAETFGFASIEEFDIAWVEFIADKSAFR